MDRATWGRERRLSARFATRVAGKLASSRGAKQRVEVSDLSSGGFSAACALGWRGDLAGYAIKLGGLEALGAELRWTTGTEAGFRFDRPLHPAVLDHIVAGNPPAPEDTPDPDDRVAAPAGTRADHG